MDLNILNQGEGDKELIVKALQNAKMAMRGKIVVKACLQCHALCAHLGHSEASCDAVSFEHASVVDDLISDKQH